MTVILLLGGAFLLYAGAEGLVHGASSGAYRLGVKPLVVGLTVVAFGTSAPELVVSTMAAAEGNSGIALGNIVGSNIFNILGILGIAGLVRPLAVRKSTVLAEVPFALGAAALAWILSLDGTLGRGDGLIFLSGFAGFLYYCFRTGTGALPEKEKGRSLPQSGMLVGLGLLFLVVGARFFVQGSVALARALGVSDLVIGLTIVAIGTSLPELATSVVASARGHHDLSIGNILGSNVFNIVAILGVAALINPISVNGRALAMDFPFMIGATGLLYLFLKPDHTLSRKESGTFLAGFLLYLVGTFLI